MSRKVDIVNQTEEVANRDDDVLELIHAVMHRHRHRMFQALRDGAHEVTHMEAKVLGFFSRQPGATPSDLAQHSGRDKAQLARLIKGLRDRELLRGEAGTADRRQVRLSLTADGQAVQRALQRQACQLADEAVAGLGADEQVQLLSLLRRVRGNLEPPPPRQPAI